MDANKKSVVSPVRLSRRHGSLVDELDPYSSPVPGSLVLSPHHASFTPERESATDLGRPPSGPRRGPQAEIDPSGETAAVLIPFTLIHSVTRTPPTFTGTPTPLVVRTRDFYTYSLEFPTAQRVDQIYDTLKHLCSTFAAGGIESRWAFSSTLTETATATERNDTIGWNLYDPEREFARMGVGKRTKAWRFTDINSDFNFCPSYPARIVVPSRISDTTLSYAVKYRSKCRIPGLVYLHWANYGSITRSSQPMVGITQTARSIQDEKLIEAIFTSHAQHSGAREAFAVSDSSASSVDASGGGVVYGAMATNVIIDARPTKNAYANSVKGAGTENMTFYKNCRKEYLGIDNIHVMRASLNGVFQAVADAETTGQVDRLALRRTNWLAHLTNILEGTLIVIRTIHLSNSHVLVHCSDGWDRTSQLSALPQICLDPFYRTARGLAVLIEKDWVAYGHKFADRSGHLCNDRVEFVTKAGGGGGGEDEDHSASGQAATTTTTTHQSFLASVQKQFASSSHAFKETCPVFQQFLDCIYQVQRQFPDRFEWNETLLRKLVWETYGARTGTFLFNSELERSRHRARETTASVWSDIFDVAGTDKDGAVDDDDEGRPTFVLKPRYRNARYDPALDDPQSKSPTSDQGVLLFNPQDVVYWHELFGRSDQELNPIQPQANPPPRPSGHATATEHDTVAVTPQDPALNPLSLQTSHLTFNRSAAPRHASTTGSPRPWPTPDDSDPSSSSAAGVGAFGQPLAVAETVASVQKFGWSAWKTVQKFGQDAAKQYKERAAATAANVGPPPPPPPPPPHEVAGLGTTNSIGGSADEHDWTRSRSSTDRTRRAEGSEHGQSGGTSSSFPTLSGGSNHDNPWQPRRVGQDARLDSAIPTPRTPTESSRGLSPSSSSTSTNAAPIPYAPYQPRVAKLMPSSSSSSSSRATTDEQRHTSSGGALSVNPWETTKTMTTITTENPLSDLPPPAPGPPSLYPRVTSSASSSSSSPNPVLNSSVSYEGSVGAAGLGGGQSGGDPLGVGGL